MITLKWRFSCTDYQCFLLIPLPGRIKDPGLAPHWRRASAPTPLEAHCQCALFSFSFFFPHHTQLFITLRLTTSNVVKPRSLLKCLNGQQGGWLQSVKLQQVWVNRQPVCIGIPCPLSTKFLLSDFLTARSTDWSVLHASWPCCNAHSHYCPLPLSLSPETLGCFRIHAEMEAQGLKTFKF